MANCSQIEPLLGAFEDGELEPHEMQEVARHLARCHDCEAALREFSSIGRYLRDAIPEPSLDGFAAAVQARIAEIPVPVGMRVRRYLDAFSQRWVTALALTSSALAVAALSTIVVLPAAREIIARNAKAPEASHEALVAQNTAAAALQVAEMAPGAAPDGDTPIIISRLESELPSVAVWNQPDTKTTVIWMPDDAGGN